MYQFTGTIKNEWRPEAGVNISVVGLNGKIILAPTGPYYILDKEQEDNTLKFTLTPSSGGTEEPRAVKVEVKNGTEKTTTAPTHWEVEITGSSDSSPVEVDLAIIENFE